MLRIRSANGEAQEINTTDGHPFWVENLGWTFAGELEIGQELVQSDGQVAVVANSYREERPDGVVIYNFEVEGDHTYFVAEHH